MKAHTLEHESVQLRAFQEEGVVLKRGGAECLAGMWPIVGRPTSAVRKVLWPRIFPAPNMVRSSSRGGVQ